MLSAVRAMAARVAHDLAHMDTRRLGPDATARGAGRAAGRGARERARGRQGGGRARPRAARHAARVGRGRRGRVRPDGDPGGLPGRPARRRRAAARAPVRAGGAAPARARVVELPLLHQLRRHRREPRRGPRSPRCSRTSATPCWSSATTARCACTSTPTSPTAPSRCSRARARCRASTSPTCTSRSPTAARGWRATARRPGAPTCAVVAVASGPGVKRLYEELGVLVVDGGATMNPSTYELLAGIHAAPGAEVLVLPNSPNVILAAERAAELSEKPARVVPDDGAAGGPRGAARVRPGPGQRRQRGGRPQGGRGAAARRRRARRARRRPGPLHRRRRGGLRGRRAGRLGRPRRDARRHARADRVGAELLTCIAGERPPLDQRRGRGRVRRTGSRWSTTRAASPRGGGCSARSDRGSPAALYALRLEPTTAARRRAGPLLSEAEPRAPSRSTAAKALQRLGIETWGDLIEHLPHAHRDRRDVRLVGELAVGEEATVAVAVRGVDRQADARPAPQARRGARVRRERAARGGLVQPALDRAPARARARRCCCTASCAAAASSGSRSSSSSAARRRRSTRSGLVPVHPATEGISAGQAARADVGGLPAHARRRSSRCRPRCASPSALPDRPAALAAVALPRPRGGRAGRAPPARVRGAVPAPAGRRRAQARAPRGPPGAAARAARRGGRPLALVAAVRADRRPGRARWRRSTRTSPASGRCSGC